MQPDAVIVSSMMTYWYPGVKETVANLRTGLPGVPVILVSGWAIQQDDARLRESGIDFRGEWSILPSMSCPYIVWSLC